MSSPAGLESPPVAPPRDGDGVAPGLEERAVHLPPASAPGLPDRRAGARLALGLGAVLFLTAMLAKGGTSLGAITLVEVGLVLLGAGVACAAALFAPTPARRWGTVTTILLAALVAWTALSVIWSVAPHDSWVEANKALAYLFAFIGGAGLARLFPWRAGSLLAGVLGATAAVCAIALALKSFPVALNSTQELARLRDPIDYWNALGLLAGFTLIAALWLAARREGPPALRALGWPLMGLGIVTVALSYSRGVLIALGIGLAFWFAVVPLRLRGLLALGVSAAVAGGLSAWAFASDALSKDRAPLDQRVSSGEDLAMLCLAMVALLFAAGLAANLRGDRRPLSPLWRRRCGLAAAGAAALAPVAVLVVLQLSGGIGHQVSTAWDNFFSKTGASTTYGPERLKSIGTRRGSYWDDALQVWREDEVLGAGAGGYATARRRFRDDPIEVRHAHGYVPQTAADLGLVGLALSLLFAIALGFAAARTLGRGRELSLRSFDPRRLPAAGRRLSARARARARGVTERMAVARPVDPDRVALLTLATLVIVFATHSLIDWTWEVPGAAVVALVCAGFLAARGPAGLPGPARGRLLSPRLITALGLVVAALCVTWTVWQPLRAERSSDAALAALSGGRANDARIQADAAHARDPLALRPLFDLSAIEEQAGRKQQAQRALELAVKLQPSNPESWTQLASYQLNSLNQPTVAFQTVKAALFLDPKSPGVRALFLEIYRRLPRRPVTPGQKQGGGAPGVRGAIERLGQAGNSAGNKGK